MRSAALSTSSAVPLEAGTTLTIGSLTLMLEVEIERVGQRSRWRGIDPKGGLQDLSVQPAAGASPPLAPSLAGAVRLPVAEERSGDLLLRVYPVEPGRPLREILEAGVPLPEALDAVEAVARAVAVVHEAGRLVLGLAPEQILIQEGRARILSEGPFVAPEDAGAWRAPVPGLSAPEAFGRGEGKLSSATDVFFLGMLLYHLASGAPRIPEAAEPGMELPRLRDWRPDTPPGLERVMRRATHRLASRRTPTAQAFLGDLRAARDCLQRRASLEQDPARYELGVESHIGLAKGRARPVNEDAAFARIDAARHKALLLVADGVSHADLGSGDEASRLVAKATEERWERLVQGRLFAGPVAPRVAGNLLLSMVRAGNEAIALRATELSRGIASERSEVMASTAVMALLDGNRAHLLNLGDSRAYLYSEGELEVLTADHDVRHEMLRAREPLAAALAVGNGSQLTRFVGRLEPREGAFVAVDPEPDLLQVNLVPGDRLLLCSDGVSDYVGTAESEVDEAIARVLAEHRDPARAAYELVVLANRAGGGDNITCIVLDVLEVSPARPTAPSSRRE
jgi:serine/threonine protein phosphatase PrpC